MIEETSQFNEDFIKNYNEGKRSEVDLGLLQHPRCSSL